MEQRSVPDGSSKEGWIQMIGAREAEGALKEVYTAMRTNMGSRPFGL